MSGIGKMDAGRSATAADCSRLWNTLRSEYIPGLRIETGIVATPEGVTYITMEVVDDALESIDGQPCVNVWAYRPYANQLYLISIGQLFDLLIEAHGRIEQFFTIGSPAAPTLRRK
jgi:hypothetical protein